MFSGRFPKALLSLSLSYSTREELARFLAVSKTTNLSLLDSTATSKTKEEIKQEPTTKLIKSVYDEQLLKGLRPLKCAPRNYACPNSQTLNDFVRNHPGYVPFGNYIAAPSGHGNIIALWDRTNNTLRELKESNHSIITSLVAVPDNLLECGFALATGRFNGLIEVWDTGADRCLGKIQTGGAEIIKLEALEGFLVSQIMVSKGGRYNLTQLWDLKRYQCFYETKTVEFFTSLSHNRIFFMDDNKAYIYDLKTRKAYGLDDYKRFWRHGREIRNAAVLSSDDYLVTTVKEIVVWDCKKGKYLGTLAEPSSEFPYSKILLTNRSSTYSNAFAVLPDNHLAGYFSFDNGNKELIVVWDLKTRKCVNRFEIEKCAGAREYEKLELIALPNGNLACHTVVRTHDDSDYNEHNGYLKIWDPHTSTFLGEMRGIHQFKLLPNGHLLILKMNDPFPQIINFSEITTGITTTSTTAAPAATNQGSWCLTM